MKVIEYFFEDEEEFNEWFKFITKLSLFGLIMIILIVVHR